jgi:neutral ceramidase
MLQAGFSRAVITPKAGVALIGYRSGVYSDGVRDDLEAVVLAIKNDDGKQLLIITVDIISLSIYSTDAISKKIEELTGITREYIVFNCSHTHTGPSERSSTGAPDDDGPWFPYALDQILKAVQEAIAKMKPSEIHVSRTHIDLNLNRSIISPDIEYTYLPDYKHLQPMVNGPVDNYLGIMTVMDVEKRLASGIIANYSCHPVFLGILSSRISADYPGEFKKAIRDTTSAEAIFFQGNCGNLHPKMPESGITGMRKFAEKLAEKTLSHSYDSSHGGISDNYKLDNPEIKSKIEKFRFEITQEVAENHYAVADTGRKGQIIKENGKIFFETNLQVVKIGDLAICALPGEVTPELTFQIKWNSPFKHTWCSYFGSDQAGYITHRWGHVHGGYEANKTAGKPIDGYRMADQYVKMLNEL